MAEVSRRILTDHRKSKMAVTRVVRLWSSLILYFDQNATHLWITYPGDRLLTYFSVSAKSRRLCFCLRLRGTVCLHASAIVVDNRALLIAGVSGAGKSTTASFFALQRHSVLSDGISALFLDGAEFVFILDTLCCGSGHPVSRPLWARMKYFPL